MATTVSLWYLLGSGVDRYSQEGKGGESEVPRGAIYWLLRVYTRDVRYDTVARRDAGNIRQSVL